MFIDVENEKETKFNEIVRKMQKLNDWYFAFYFVSIWFCFEQKTNNKCM